MEYFQQTQPDRVSTWIIFSKSTMELQAVLNAVADDSFSVLDFKLRDMEDTKCITVTSTIQGLKVPDNTEMSKLMLKLGELRENGWRLVNIKAEEAVAYRQTDIRLIKCPSMKIVRTITRKTKTTETKILYKPERGIRTKKRKRCEIDQCSNTYRLRRAESDDEDETPRKWGALSGSESDSTQLEVGQQKKLALHPKHTAKAKRRRQTQRKLRLLRRSQRKRKQVSPIDECTNLMTALTISELSQRSAELGKENPEPKYHGNLATPSDTPTGKALAMLKLQQNQEGATGGSMDKDTEDIELTEEEEKALLWDTGKDEWEQLTGMDTVTWQDLGFDIDDCLNL